MYVRVKYIVALLLVFVTVACANDDVYDIPSPDSESVAEDVVELRFGVPSTRATLDEDLNLRWERGDKISLIAYDGANQIFAKESSYWATLTSGNQGGLPQSYFKAKFNPASDGSVLAAIENFSSGKCYAISPVNGVSISGTSVTMTIPSVQSGEYSSAYDFMTARSEEISELKLSNGSTDDYINNIDLKFQHHTHAFRVTIPGNNLGKAVTKAYVRFPFNVVGDMTVDYTTGAVTSNATSKLVVVEFATPKTAGDEFWVFIAGVENKGKVDIRFQTADGTFTERRVANFSQQNWSAGKISKVRMSVPQAATYTTVKYTVAYQSTLGEPVTNLHMTLPEEYYFPDYGQSYNAANVGGAHEFVFFSDVIDSTLQNSTVNVSYESAHAMVPSSVKFNAYSHNAPYLFEENFSAVTGKKYFESAFGGIAGEDTHIGITMDDVGLTGWTGAKFRTNANTSLTIASYIGSSIAGSATDCQNGRVDTKQLYLKPNCNATIRVSYNVTGFTEASAAKTSCYFGTTTTMGPIDSTTSYKNPTQPDKLVDNYEIAGGSKNSVVASTPKTHNISGCDSTTRLTWCCNPTSVETGWLSYVTSKYFYVHIDDIQVSIVQ